MSGTNDTNVLSVRGLSIRLATRDGGASVVDDASFDVGRGEVFGIVGESGCGKSVTAYAIAGLLPTPPLRVEAGSVRLGGRELLSASPAEMRSVRGKDIGMIFQEPMTALDPLYTIGEQIAESLEFHSSLDKRAAMEKAIAMLGRVGIPEPRRIAAEYPHRLSGGMLQRVVIAMAMINEPALLIADEPTTALDVTIQAQILALMNDLVGANGMSMVLITHDLGVVAETCDRVAVFYGGHLVESAPVDRIFAEPLHPYTDGLRRSVESIGGAGGKLYAIPGSVPSAGRFGPGCRFHDRCGARVARCGIEAPPTTVLPDGRTVRCWLRGEEA
ncbi:MAG TPA: ABC transporter ATP-binding protein [Spirochaetia bacterium]|nr:ABC transporter ATP-binding protein [Spirochaetaceae bacterium]HPE88663.1 ABC transporter ATP-binding protein [Spirochaetales bacterium]HRW23500.1 ABC transporter ATP-binding protein [Spirochaetia bacterium]